MLNIESVLNYIKKGIVSGDERYHVIDDQHVLDKHSGIKLHIYDDWFKVTHDGKVVATMRDFDTTVEQPIVWSIKALITPAELMESKKESYMQDIKQRREKLSSHLENPVAVVDKSAIIEDDTVSYTG